MTTKNITVDGYGPVTLGSREDYKSFREDHGVRCLVDKDGRHIEGYDALVEGGEYTWGPKRNGKFVLVFLSS